MFERFTDRARRVVVLAQEESRLLMHNYIGTEHLLLGLVGEGKGVAALVLTGLGVELDEVRNRVLERIGTGNDTPTGHIPFTPRAKKVLELALREALQMGHNYIGTEHLLLALIREGEGVGASVLESFGMSLDRVRTSVIEKLSTIGSQHETKKGRGIRSRPLLVGDLATGPMTERAMRMLSFAREEATNRGSETVDIRDFLIALILERGTSAERALASFGVTVEELRKRLEKPSDEGAA